MADGYKLKPRIRRPLSVEAQRALTELSQLDHGNGVNTQKDKERRKEIITSPSPEPEKVSASRNNELTDDIKFFIPLEKSYRSELRQMSSSIGLNLNDSEQSKAAWQFIKKNPKISNNYTKSTFSYNQRKYRTSEDRNQTKSKQSAARTSTGVHLQESWPSISSISSVKTRKKSVNSITSLLEPSKSDLNRTSKVKSSAKKQYTPSSQLKGMVPKATPISTLNNFNSSSKGDKTAFLEKPLYDYNNDNIKNYLDDMRTRFKITTPYYDDRYDTDWDRPWIQNEDNHIFKTVEDNYRSHAIRKCHDWISSCTTEYDNDVF